LSSIQLIYFRLSQFIKTYYLQKIALGIVKIFLICSSLYLIFTNIEYHFYLSQIARAVVFWGFLFVSVLMIFLLIIIPLLEYFNHKKRLGRKEAAKLIGQHFPDISDKLLNMLELDEMHHSNQENQLIEASINQKTQQLQFYRFQKAIDWSGNKKWLKWMSIPAVIFLVILLFYPAILSESTHRIIRYDSYFEPKAPFDFEILNPNLDVLDYHDFKGFVMPEITVDEYAAKIGKDSDIVTLAFLVKSKNAGDDLANWLETGYDYILDASVSDGELSPGHWLVFAEMDRRLAVPERIVEIIEDMVTLTNLPVEDWTITIDDKKYKADPSLIKGAMILSPHEYREQKESDQELNEFRTIAGLENKKVFEKLDKEIRDFTNSANI
jgi:hypothetical protein